MNLTDGEVKEKMIKEILVLRGSDGKEIAVPISTNQLILTITYMNWKFADELKNQGIPLIADKSEKESRLKSMVKKANLQFRKQGIVRPRLLSSNIIMEGTGKSVIQEKKVAVNGSEILSFFVRTLKKRGIEDIFLRTRKMTTDVRTAKSKYGFKYTTKIYALMDKKKGSKKVSIDELTQIFGDFIESTTWFFHVWRNPESTVFAITFKNPPPKLHPILYRVE